MAKLIAFDEERPTTSRMAGLVLGFLGVATLLGPWRGLGGGQLIGNFACAAAAVCYGFGWPYTRRHLAGRAESGVVLSACQLGVTIASLGLGAVTEPAVVAILQPVLKIFSASMHIQHGIAFGVAFALSTSLHIVIGEQAPKNWSIASRQRFAT